MPPPSAEMWVVKVERDHARFGKQTWWRIEGDAPGGAAAGERTVRLQVHLSRTHQIPTSTHPSNHYPQPLSLAPHCNQAHETGGYLNYREADMVRGHGNRPPWKPAGRLASTELRLQSLTLTELLSDMKHWRERKAGCLAPCAVPPPSPPPDASAAPVATAAVPLAAPALSSAGVWSEVCSKHCQPSPSPSPQPKAPTPNPDQVCWKHYGEPTCAAIVRARGVRPGVSWGSAPPALRLRWARLDCDKYIEPSDVTLLAAEAEAEAEAEASSSPLRPLRTMPPIHTTTTTAAAAAAAATSAAAAAPLRAIDAASVHCVAPTDGVLLLMVSDRPNQFLCASLASALAHGLRPTLLGWDPPSWLDAHKKPWSYHLGAKLVLPLEYLRRCGATIPNSTLVLFTDHDVVFQGGAAQLRAAYERAVAVGPQSAGGAKLELVFSTEKESYPRELAALYPRPPAGAISSYLNSGMWMGPAGAAREMLAVMGGLRRGEQLATLLRHYHNWGRLDTKKEPIPQAFAENDQTAYAGLYVAQHFADTCRPKGGGDGGDSGGGGGAGGSDHRASMRGGGGVADGPGHAQRGGDARARLGHAGLPRRTQLRTAQGAFQRGGAGTAMASVATGSIAAHPREKEQTELYLLWLYLLWLYLLWLYSAPTT